MNAIVKYLQETRAELRHVAWPTQTQTIVYTVIVIILSVAVSLYLGLFDYLFTSSLTRGVSALPETVNEIQIPAPSVEDLIDLESSSLEVQGTTEGGETFKIVPTE